MVAIAVIFPTLFWLSMPVMQIGFLPTHDYAVDMLYTNSISLNNPLLVGHYSRFGFNHPGPFWFYWNKLIEICLEWLSIPRYNLWMIGSIVINTLLITFSGHALSGFIFDKAKISVTFILLGCLLVLAGGDFLSTWMPNRMVCAYIALFVCLLDISKGKIKYFSWCVLLVCVLIHGYITMPVFTLLPLLLALVLLCLNHKRGECPNAVKTQLWISAIVIFLFIAPLAIDALHSNGGNVSNILLAQQGLATQPKPSWTELLHFYRQLVFDQTYSKIFYVITIFLLVFVCLFSKRDHKRRVLGTLIFSILLSILLVVYYKTTPAPLYPYIARFYIGVPVVLATVIWSTSAESLISSISNKMYQAWVSVLAGSLLLGGAILHSNRHNYPVWSEVRWGDAIRTFAETIGNTKGKSRPIAIGYSEYNQWSFIAGLMVELTHRHISACVTQTQMSILYTPKMTCSGADVQPDYLVVDESACEKQCAVALTGFGLVDVNNPR